MFCFSSFHSLPHSTTKRSGGYGKATTSKGMNKGCGILLERRAGPSKVVDGVEVCKSNVLLTQSSSTIRLLLISWEVDWEARSLSMIFCHSMSEVCIPWVVSTCTFRIFWLCRPHHASRCQSGLYKPVATGQGVIQMQGVFGDLGYCTSAEQHFNCRPYWRWPSKIRRTPWTSETACWIQGHAYQPARSLRLFVQKMRSAWHIY